MNKNNLSKKELFDNYGEEICKLCDEYIEKRIDPQCPICEGRWCDEAIDIFLESEDLKDNNGNGNWREDYKKFKENRGIQQ
jgi:hypothetical protein